MKIRLLVTLLFSSLIAAGIGHAATLGPLQVTCNGVNCGAVNVQTNLNATTINPAVNGDITAQFNALPNLAAAMAACCGHYNWMNIVVAATANSTPRASNDFTSHAAVPWIDPSDGGSFGFGFNDPADTLPFYYDEQPVVGGIPLAGQVAGNTLNYFDHPSNAANVTWTFDTYLVLVRGPAGQTDDQVFAPLIGFTWTFTENATATAENITGLAALPINAAQIALINTALDAPQNEDFGDWTAVDAASICPEPGTVGMLFGGLGVLVVVARRRRAA